MSGPVTITGNEARYEGGAIWTEAAELVLPSDAEISGNTAIVVSTLLLSLFLRFINPPFHFHV